MNKQKVTPSLGEAEDFSKKYGGTLTQLLQHWYMWGEKHNLAPVADPEERDRLFLSAKEEGWQRVPPPTRLANTEFKSLTDTEKIAALSALFRDLDEETRDVLGEKGYLILPFAFLTEDSWCITVDTRTIEVAPHNLFEPQRYIPIHAEVLFKRPEESSLTWRDFHNDYVEKTGSGLKSQSVQISDKVQSKVKAHLLATYRLVANWIAQPKEAQVPDITLITSKLAGHMNGFITSREESLMEQLHTRKDGRPELVSARSRLNLPRGTERPDTMELLEKMHRTLLRHKEESASLLKTHLYLVDRAYRRGGDSPTFTVDMDELLEAKGYKRRADGSFQASTYREEWGRIATLAGCWLELRRIAGKGKRGKEEIFIDETPYWEVRARRRLEEGEALGLETILLEDPSAPIIKAVVIQPGLWWGVSDRSTMYFHLPREMLALPTDGKGNETQRMAVQLAATLALWVRSSQQQHAGEECAYSVGALLEASGIRTRLEFDGMNRVEVGRLRKYLAGEEGDDEPHGALHHLTSLGAFDIRIRDEADFWASGRGWQTRFWEAQLSVRVPDLGIKKLGRSQTKRKALKQASA